MRNGASRGSEMKILVVDDDLDFLESLQLVLVMQGHTVHPATNGRDSVTAYEEFEPDIVLLDVNMPDIDGYEVFRRLRQSDLDARIYLMSGYALENDKYEDAKSHSLAGLLTKPIDTKDLDKVLAGTFCPE